MGLFDKIFQKKECSVCGGEIGLLGNRKLEDGNLCKNCASQLSPWFSDRRNSTVEEIKAQLAYREENKKEVAQFNVTRSIGDNMKVLLDEDAKKFVVTAAGNLREANPDVISFAQVTGCDIDIQEGRQEVQRKDAEGNMVSYNPPRYTYDYDFYFTIYVNHPYFDDITFRMNSDSVITTPETGVPDARKPNPRFNVEYKEYDTMAQELKEILTDARQQAREEQAAANAPKEKLTCPWCGATTVPDASGCCEYCGGSMNG